LVIPFLLPRPFICTKSEVSDTVQMDRRKSPDEIGYADQYVELAQVLSYLARNTVLFRTRRRCKPRTYPEDN